jgi:hypothetical protein
MVVFMTMAAQFKSLRHPIRHAIFPPRVARGYRDGADDRGRFAEGAEKLEAVVAAARSRFVPFALASVPGTPERVPGRST